MQNYQVFVNDHLLTFGDFDETYEQSQTYLFIKAPHEEIYRSIVDWLFRESSTMHVHFQMENVQESFSAFIDCFQVIHAAGGLVFNENNEVLWIKRLGKWDLPKGKIEKGETIEDAAIREVEEECGIQDLTITQALPSTFHMYVLKEKVVFKETHWFEMKTAYSGNLTPQTEEDIEEVAWINAKKQSPYIESTYASIRSLLSEKFA